MTNLLTEGCLIGMSLCRPSHRHLIKQVLIKIKSQGEGYFKLIKRVIAMLILTLSAVISVSLMFHRSSTKAV